MKFLRYVWASPATIVGVVASLAFKRRFVVRGVLVGEGASWPRRLGWRYRAITLGHCVLCVDEIDPDLMAHEMVHVRQFERWGPLLLFAYPAASVRALASGGHYYRDNYFEAQARASTTPVPPGGGESERPPT
jgi:hypothetical protein